MGAIAVERLKAVVAVRDIVALGRLARADTAELLAELDSFGHQGHERVLEREGTGDGD